VIAAEERVEAAVFGRPAMVAGAAAGATLVLRVGPLSALAVAVALLLAVSGWAAAAARRPAAGGAAGMAAP
jgi:NAD/NADP transhydrogenase beta subunit